MDVRRLLTRHLKPLVGLGFVLVLLLMVWAAVLSFRKELPWQDTVDVTLTTSVAGLGLTAPADVKLHGVRVGEVREISSDGRTAVLRIALDPLQAPSVPANIDATIVPKTLFGEKYVNLRMPQHPARRHIAAGGRIHQSETSVEIGRLFTNLNSTLEALDPQQLSRTVNALADALHGRGERLGQTLTLLQTYLERLNPHLDTLAGDLRKTAETADIYAAAAGDLVRVLDNTRALSRDLLVPRERSFRAFLDRTIAAADKAADVLEAHGQQIVTLVGRQRPVLEVLAKYAPEFPCLAESLVLLERARNRAVGGSGPYFRVSVDAFVDRTAYRYPQDSPSNPASDAHNDTLPTGVDSWAPHCPHVPERFDALRDQPEPSAEMPARSDRSSTTTPLSAPLATAIAARMLDRPAEQVPPVATLLIAPLTRAEEVRLP